MAGNGAHAGKERAFGVTLNSTVKEGVGGLQDKSRRSPELSLLTGDVGFSKCAKQASPPASPASTATECLTLPSYWDLGGGKEGSVVLVIQRNMQNDRISRALLLFFQPH